MKPAVLGLMVAGAWLGWTGAQAQAPDPFLGTWSLDVKASKYEAAEMPRHMLITMAAVAGGVHYRSETEYASGRMSKTEYTADYDEHLAAVLGDHGMYLPVLIKRIDDHTLKVSYIQGLRVVATSRRIVSHDGRKLTIVTTSRDGAGKDHVNIGIYVKQH